MSIDILFDPIAHKYTNRRNDPFISVTTLRDLYIDKFSDKEVEIALRCEAIGKNRMHPKHLKYRYKTATQLLEEWSKESTRASINGNEKHEYLETEIKIASSFKSCSNTTSNRLFTVSDILENESIGILDLTVFDNSGVKTLYPQIYTIIENFIKAGWRIFSEVCTYHLELMVSGLIDIILVKGNKFVILDWKTNKSPVRFEAGYYDKDNKGNILDVFIYKNSTFKHPLLHLADSIGNKYAMQLSIYAYMTELLGFNCEGLILCHIEPGVYTSNHDKVKSNPLLLGKPVVNIMTMSYLKDETTSMFNHYNENKYKHVAKTLF